MHPAAFYETVPHGLGMAAPGVADIAPGTVPHPDTAGVESPRLGRLGRRGKNDLRRAVLLPGPIQPSRCRLPLSA